MANNTNHCPMGTTPYIVRQGDTFYLIAKRENVSLDSLLKANPGIDPNRLFIGQVICIPSSSPGPGPSPTHPCPTLAQGSRGSYVTDLQTRLKAQGFNPGAIDGNFGPNTKAAVMAFQKSKGLVQDGIVGVNTWTALGVNCGSTPGPGPSPTHPCPTLAQGSRGSYVTDLQTRLKAQGFNPGTIDGNFGPNTKSAVMAFQKSKGLVQDGIVGVNTWTALGVNCGSTPPGKCPVGTFPHTIKSGENFYILANRYNVSLDAILKANPGVNPNALQIGQVVCIPNK